jgi:glutamine amidotransferase
MQWNRLLLNQPAHPMVQALGSDPWVYFVHSYAPPEGNGVVATCEYGGTVVAAVAQDGIWATQFHPEKSGPVGLALLRNFIAAVAGSPNAGAVSSAAPAGLSRPPSDPGEA